MADGNSMTHSSATHGAVTQRRALAALILAESERNGAGYGTRLPTERQLARGPRRCPARPSGTPWPSCRPRDAYPGRWAGTFLRLAAADRPDVRAPDPAVVRAGIPDAAAGSAEAALTEVRLS